MPFKEAHWGKGGRLCRREPGDLDGGILTLVVRLLMEHCMPEIHTCMNNFVIENALIKIVTKIQTILVIMIIMLT